MYIMIGLAELHFPGQECRLGEAQIPPEHILTLFDDCH